VTAPHLAPGHTVAGKYQVRQLLGFTGEVASYRASDSQGRDVVVKLYDPAIGQRADVMGRLERVHAAVSQLPAGAVRVLDAGYDAGSGAPFSVSEFVAWPTLTQWLARTPLQPPMVARVLQSLAQVMDPAHQAQLCHGALKPTNVFVSPGGEGQVRVTDFGASVVRSTSPTHEAYAQSAPWWAPEQLNASAVLGPATDIFAVGLLAFYALTGRSFWVSCQAATPDLKAWQQEVMGPRPLASARARELGAVVNPALDVAFERVLAVGQRERPQSVGELAHQFGALAGYADDPNNPTLALDGGADSALTPGLPPVPLENKRKQSSPIVPIVIGVGAAVVLGGVGLGYLFTRTDPLADAPAATPAPEPAATEVAGDSDEDPAAAAAPTEPETPTGDDGAAGGADGADEGAGGADTAELVEVKIVCEPACLSLIVDGEVNEKPEEPLQLSPGDHTIKLMKPGYVVRTEKVEVVADKPIEKTFALTKRVYRPQKKRCSKFLKNCR